MQNGYLQKHIKSQPVKQSCKPKDANNPGSHCSCTLTYTLPHAATTYSVCKMALDGTRIVSALNSTTATGMPTPNMRVWHKPPNAVLNESARLASDHIDSFPTVMSYSHAKSPKLKFFFFLPVLVLQWISLGRTGKVHLYICVYNNIVLFSVQTLILT